MDEKALRAAGIDYDAALARFVGKSTIYEKYLARFLEDAHTADAVKAYGRKDYEEMLEQVHALKGVAGTLGLTVLYEVSADIVKDLRDGTFQGLEEKMERLCEEQKKLCDIIRNA